MTRTEFFAKVNKLSEVTLGELLLLANGNAVTLTEWLNCDEAFGSGGIVLGLHEDMVDDCDPSNHPESIWDGTLMIENNAFYWCGSDGPSGGRNSLRTRVYRHSLFDVY